LADKIKVKQVLVNLIKNGIESMEGGGNLVIRSLSENDYIKIDIADTGVGLSKDQIRFLGTPFHTTKKNGTGLGLVVCYQIIESLHGKINVRSEMGKGTEFSNVLPQYQQKNISS
jgi:two-component system, sporulation sensor kinase B